MVLPTQGDKVGHARFQQVSGVFENRCARGDRGGIPGGLGGVGVAERTQDGGGIGGGPVADVEAAVGGAVDEGVRAGGGRARHQRGGRPGFGIGLDVGGECGQLCIVGEIDAH